MINNMHSLIQSGGRNHIILTVDDDPNNLAVLRDCLVESNFTILVAEDGESAVKRADYAHPDLILLDIMMEGIDGYETCRRLKSLESTKEIPVIFMTALSETGHKVKGLEVGAVDYITKPFQREELLARIAVHLQNRELTIKLQEVNELLEKRVEERTAELAQTIDTLHHEIMERKRAEEERVRLATAIEQAAEAIFMSDAQWRFTYVNPAFERISGYARDEVLGQDTAVLRSNALEQDYYDQIRELISQENVWSGRISTKKKDASIFEAETTVSSVRDSKGCIINYVFILRDVTHELKLERDLRQAQKMEAIGTLAAGIAHDFNNILTAIVGFTEMSLRKIPAGNPVHSDLERVLESGMRATDLVRQILTFSRQSEQEQKPVLMTPIIKESLKLLRSSLPATIEIRQESSIMNTRDLVLADQTQLHQVLMNLGTNAAHAMRANGGALRVNLTEFEVDTSFVLRHPHLRPGPYLKLTVTDTGHGMDPAVMERIFDPYFTTKDVGEGTGMGLAVVQGIVKSHGGEITVYSEPGRGTAFHVFLPRFEGDTIHEEKTVAVEIGGTERVLFVDDEALLAELGQELLESLGYTVTVTLSSREALKLFNSDPQAFDLVITDMTMPGLTGRELARKLLSIRPDIPIILCTGFSEHTKGKQIMESGIREVITKPYVLRTIATTIRRVLDTSAAC